MTIASIQQGAFRGSPHFAQAVADTILERAIYLLDTAPPTPSPQEVLDLNYAKQVVQNRRSPSEMIAPLVASNTWDLTFDAWASAEAAGDRYAIGAGVQALWPIFAETA